MKLSSGSAQRIVDEIGGLVGQHINMMDEQGIIIASTDPTRMGAVHQGALRIIGEGLPELYIRPEDAAEGARAGLNLPIQHQGKMVGVIGITGEYAQVIGYGRVVKKMTEILLREKVERDDQRLARRMRSRFLEDWLTADSLTPEEEEALAQRGFDLGVDITLPRRVLVVGARNSVSLARTVSGQKRLEAVEETVRALTQREWKSMTFRSGARQILLLEMHGEGWMERRARELCQAVEQTHGVVLLAGIDGGGGEARRSVRQAQRAWQAARLLPEGICRYAAAPLELLLAEVPKRTREAYLRQVFGAHTPGELAGWLRLLEAYFAADGSISRAAEGLFMHKNTLQYQLKRLAEHTGFDVRRPSSMPALYTALLFGRELELSGVEMQPSREEGDEESGDGE